MAFSQLRCGSLTEPRKWERRLVWGLIDSGLTRAWGGGHGACATLLCPRGREKTVCPGPQPLPSRCFPTVKDHRHQRESLLVWVCTQERGNHAALKASVQLQPGSADVGPPVTGGLPSASRSSSAKRLRSGNPGSALRALTEAPGTAGASQCWLTLSVGRGFTNLPLTVGLGTRCETTNVN